MDFFELFWFNSLKDFLSTLGIFIPFYLCFLLVEVEQAIF